MTIHLAIFASGNGTNAESIIKHFAGHPVISVKVVLSNKTDAKVLERAAQYGIPTVTFPKEELYHTDKIESLLEKLEVEWIILAGFLLKVPKKMLLLFPDRIINIHPALLPKYGGKGMYGMHIHRAVVAAGETETGITIHFVNENYDEGAIIFQEKVLLDKNDTPEDVAKKIQLLEHIYFPKVIEKTILKNYSNTD